jgi:hypothetical protein
MGDGVDLMSEAPAQAAQASSRRFSTRAVAVGLGLVTSVLGLGVGWLWHLVTPRALIMRVEGGFVYLEEDPEQLIGADGWFLLIGLITGVVLAVLAWVVLRHFRGWAVLVALAVGSLVAGWLAWWLGVRLEEAYLATLQATASVGDQVRAPAVLRITDLSASEYWPPKLTGVVAAQALASVAMYTVLAGFAAHPDLHPDGAKALEVLEPAPYPTPERP